MESLPKIDKIDNDDMEYICETYSLPLMNSETFINIAKRSINANKVNITSFEELIDTIIPFISTVFGKKIISSCKSVKNM